MCIRDRLIISFDLGESSDSGNVDTDVVFLQYKGMKPLTFTLGKHKVPNMMDIQTSSNDIAFIERSQVANIMTTSISPKIHHSFL